MRAQSLHFLWIVVLTSVSCGRSRELPAPAADRRAAEDEIAWFQSYWLGPARVAPPTIVFEPRSASRGSVVATFRPVLPEEAAWNQWVGDGARLFNNRAGYLFEVEVTGPGRLRWVPDRTSLRLNGASVALAPAPTAEDMLGPLLSAALEQEQLLLDGDLVERTRGAGAFRAAYLPLAPAPDRLEGVILFPTDDPERHVTDVELVVSVQTPQGVQELTARWD